MKIGADLKINRTKQELIAEMGERVKRGDYGKESVRAAFEAFFDVFEECKVFGFKKPSASPRKKQSEGE